MHNRVEARKINETKPIKKHFEIKEEKRFTTAKYREIYYPNHLDAHIYSYYTKNILEPLYEEELKKDKALNESVIAYRRIQVANQDRCKSNIDFANEIFDEIKRTKGETAVLALDISKFFDSLDHKLLKQAWSKLLNRKDLPPDHYNLFKSLTQFNFVEMKDLLKEFGFKHPNQLIQKDISHFIKNGVEFRTRIKEKGLLKKNSFRKKCENEEIKVVGIPQGTPISAFLANLYLLEFDKKAIELLKPSNGIYRRYSDDIFIICPRGVHSEIESEIYSLIAKNFLLEIQPTKTQRTFFINGRLEKGEKPVNYLGFQFDGNRKLLKSASVSKFYRKMKRAVGYRASRAIVAKQKLNRGTNVDVTLHRKQLYKQFSFLGAKMVKKKKRNYFSYAYFAARVMNSPHIKKQLSKAWSILHTEIQRSEKKYKIPTIGTKK